MRSLKKIIIHSSATPEGRDDKVEDIRRWHKAKGWSDIGYHFVIELNGALRIGRPLERVGAHAKGHNRGSIGICYVGGADKDLKPKDTLTDDQQSTLEALIIDLKRSYSTISEVIGHNEVSSKACPGFKVSDKLSI